MLRLSSVEVLVQRTYDIFEMVEGGPLWRAAITGHELALATAKELGSQTENEVRVIYVPDKAVVAIINQKASAEP